MAKNDLPAPPARKGAAYVVAAGISTVGILGIIVEGKEVAPGDLEGGQRAFDELVERGVLVPRPEKKPDASS